MQLEAFSDSRHESAIRLASALPLVSPDSRRTWIQMAVEGTWEGHTSGSFAFTQDVFRQIKANFDTQKNPVPLTYEHPEMAMGQPIPAAGWIHALSVRGNELWGHVEFSERAAAMVKAGEYRYCSVVVNFSQRNPRTGDPQGPTLLELGLTNVPFLDGMEPIRLSYRAAVPPHPETTRKLSMDPTKAIMKVAKALGLDESASAEQLSQALAGVIMQRDAMGEDGSQAADAPSEEEEDEAQLSLDAAEAETVKASIDTPVDAPVIEAAADGDPIGMLAEAAGMSPEDAAAALMAHLDEVAALLAGGSDMPDDQAAFSARDAAAEVRKLAARVSETTQRAEAAEQRVAELEQGAKQTENAHRLSQAIEAGHVLEGEREFALKLSQASQELFDDYLARSGKEPAVPQGSAYKAAPAKGTAKTGTRSDDLVKLSDAERTKYEMFRGGNYSHDEAIRKALEAAAN